jgi:superfamily II DNA or RNA helicase
MPETNIFPTQSSNPTPGMLAIVRRRRGVVSEVRDFDSGPQGRLHLVRIEYKDDASPAAEELLWELEPSKTLLEANEIPRADADPMRPDDFDALVRAARWTAISPYVRSGEGGDTDLLPICSPFHGALEVDDYQLIPLLKALRMPRISMMIADDVGLGKTIEAGLILNELLIRRKINRVMILTPASLRVQWRDELWDKFSLVFDVIDRDATLKIKRRVGIDANPWRYCPRIIASYHYLKQPDVFEQFMSASRHAEGTPRLPWDLLIVDEVHNLMPSPFGEDSQLCETLRLIAPLFEHRLFLTATPHNGHTRSFTGLLELLDPVRFSRTDALHPAEKERIEQVVIRRLKREINARTDPPRFCTRKPPHALLLDRHFSTEERNLIGAFEAFRGKVRQQISRASKKRRLSGSFAIEILGKRLLSGPMTFLESWRRCKTGLLEPDAADDNDIRAARKSIEEETADDLEAQQKETTAANVIGAWMKPFADTMKDEIDAIDQAAASLRVDLDQPVIFQNPQSDARFDALCELIDAICRNNGDWREDDRLVVFTEYKTTLDYVLRRLRETYAGAQDRFLTLYGGMNDGDREDIKTAFNDPDARVRVLVATDAAAEGLNLQHTARFLLHYDCPWNPSRLEQRNGRLDRHGQARDVSVFHFASEQDADLKFLHYLIGKVDQIREDLGAVADLFDEATHRRLIRGDALANVQQQLELQMDRIRKETSISADNTQDADAGAAAVNPMKDLRELAKEIDLDAHSAKDALEAAMAADAGRPQLSPADELKRFDILDPGLPGWKDAIDDTIRRQLPNRTLGPVPRLTFSSRAFMQTIGDREVFRPRLDTLMLHLGHPLMQKAKGALTRRRFPGSAAVSRWTARYDHVPEGADALIVLHMEELGINALRETFHHWIHTVRLPVYGNRLGDALPSAPAADLRDARSCKDADAIQRARDVLDEFELDLQQVVKNRKKGTDPRDCRKDPVRRRRRHQGIGQTVQKPTRGAFRPDRRKHHEQTRTGDQQTESAKAARGIVRCRCLYGPAGPGHPDEAGGAGSSPPSL